jgi:hypothetical protein
MQVFEVLELKLVFWGESIKENPRLIKLQEEGLKIVDQMYQLNIFYNEVVKKY